MAEAKQNNNSPYAVLSRSGDKMPLFGLGTWNSTNDEGIAAVEYAIKQGYRAIDGAFIYQNELQVGEAVLRCVKEGVVKREDLFITTKLWIHSTHPDDVESACRQSLKLLQMDYVDLYLIHWPFTFQRGSIWPLDDNGKLIGDKHTFIDAWPAMESLVEKGLAKNIGVCNFNIEQLNLLRSKAKIQPSVLQVECHPFLPQVELIKYCKENNMLMTAYSPFVSPGTKKDKTKATDALNNEVVLDIAKKYGKTAANVLIRFQLDRGVSVIPKSTNPKRISSNAEVFDFKLSEDDIKRLEALSTGYRCCPFKDAIELQNYPFSKKKSSL